VGTQFGADFSAWQNDVDQGASLDQISADADQVSADCAVAGVPGLFGDTGSSPAVTAPTQQTDPNGQQCASLDSQGYCPGDDPAPPAPTMTKQTDTIVFKVWGTGEPSIQYGTDSSTNNPSDSAGPLGDGNYLPWQASMPYGLGALYYAVTAQLEGSGSIHDSVTEVVTTWCSGSKPKTESFPLASGNASGGYGIAMAEYADGDTGNATQAESDAGC
jgi:hypothetical protein